MTSSPLTAEGMWGTSAPCVDCEIWTLVHGSFGALHGKPCLDEHGRCSECVRGQVAAELRKQRRRHDRERAIKAQSARTPGDAWRRIVSTSVCYVQTVGNAAPVALIRAANVAIVPMRAEAEWRRDPNRGPSPAYPADLLWRVFDEAVRAVEQGKILATGIGTDLVALVKGMPIELKREIRA